MMRIPLPPGLLSKPIAHRALHDRAAGRPENSIAAIRAAIAKGYPVEIDLQRTADDVAMVFHDEEVARLTTGRGLVRDLTCAQMQSLTLRDSADPVPTLAQVLELVAGQVPILIEIKDQTDALAQTDGRLETSTAALLATYAGPVAVMSFNPHSVAHMARLAPKVARGLTTSAYDPADWAPIAPDRCRELRDIPDYDRTLSSFISHELADLARPRLRDLAAQGAAILCWTVPSLQAEVQARKVAQNITFEGYLA